ncbi:Peptidyl-prolyl cis-trans isomerase FKBP4 [Trichoplax sp. H2]|nr:Peptidyl-prolyl cis-trans isomerase FKBP4 [Trichoplax sp. H2]|eukprot:RDD38997.1 Peptidyl-prolyl cis-trans isomerase FKBP4 [Trichoplax sp. H2]
MGNEDFYQRHITRLGQDLITPNVGSFCTVIVTGKLVSNNTIIDSRYDKEVEWKIGQGDTELCEVIDDCLQSMHAGDICNFTLKPDEAYYILKEEDIHIDQDIEVVYEVQLKKFIKAKETWYSTVEELFNEAISNKARGVNLYKSGKVIAAARRFSIALKYLIIMESDRLASRNDEHSNLRKNCYLNLATCQAKHNMHRSVIANCSKVLQMEPNNLKALFKRGVAYTAVNDFDNAKADLESAKLQDPSNKAVIMAIQNLFTKTLKQNKFYQQALAGMFQSKSK